MIITLTTDFGTKDGYVGAMKGRILKYCPEARLVDISHDISPQNIQEGAFTIQRALPEFPAGGFHLVVVDPGVGSERKALMIETEIGWLVGPDNGIFDLLLKQYPAKRIYSIHKQTKWWEAHATFDGLALFSPATALLAAGKDPDEMGELIQHIQSLEVPDYRERPMEVYFEILYFDRFGNAITNLPALVFHEYADKGWKVIFRDYELPFTTNYHSMKPNFLCCLVNSDGMVELAVQRGNAEKSFKLKKKEKLRLACDKPELFS